MSYILDRIPGTTTERETGVSILSLIDMNVRIFKMELINVLRCILIFLNKCLCCVFID